MFKAFAIIAIYSASYALKYVNINLARPQNEALPLESSCTSKLTVFYFHLME